MINDFICVLCKNQNYQQTKKDMRVIFFPKKVVHTIMGMGKVLWYLSEPKGEIFLEEKKNFKEKGDFCVDLFSYTCYHDSPIYKKRIFYKGYLSLEVCIFVEGYINGMKRDLFYVYSKERG